MAALCTEAELEQLLQEVDEIPSAQELYSFNFDPTWGTMDPLDPNFPILEEGSLLHAVRQTPGVPGLTPPSSVISEEHGLPFEDTLEKIKELEAQVLETKSELKRLKDFISQLEPWLLEVMEALENLGGVPPSASSQLTFDA